MANMTAFARSASVARGADAREWVSPVARANTMASFHPDNWWSLLPEVVSAAFGSTPDFTAEHLAKVLAR